MQTDMRLTTKPGEMVIFLGENGTDHEREEASKILKVGEKYQVRGVEVGGWISRVRIGQRWFNTVMFANVEFPKSASPSAPPSATDIPYDIMHVARSVLSDHRKEPDAGCQNAEAMTNLIARAILAERQECVRLASERYRLMVRRA